MTMNVYSVENQSIFEEFESTELNGREVNIKFIWQSTPRLYKMEPFLRQKSNVL